MKNTFSALFLIPLFLISCGKTEELKTVVNPPIVEKQVVATSPVMENPIIVTNSISESNSGKIETTLTGIISKEKPQENSVTFSDAQIKDILVKIDENKKVVFTPDEKNLIEGDESAKYLTSKDSIDDKIIISISGKDITYSLSYNKDNNETQKKCGNDKDSISCQRVRFAGFAGFYDLNNIKCTKVPGCVGNLTS